MKINLETLRGYCAKKRAIARRRRSVGAFSAYHVTYRDALSLSLVSIEQNLVKRIKICRYLVEHPEMIAPGDSLKRRKEELKTYQTIAHFAGIQVREEQTREPLLH